MALGPGLTSYNVITASDKHLHRTRRQLIGQVLTERSMRVFEPTMIEQVNLFVRNLLHESQKSNPVEMTTQIRRLGVNIAGLLGFGYDLRLQTDDENQFIQTVLDGGTWASNVMLHYPTPRRLRLGLLLMLPLFKVRDKYLNLIETMITSRMTQPKDAKHDLYSFVADALDSGSDGLRQGDLWAEANMFLSAG
jgi:cytochrome P450